MRIRVTCSHPPNHYVVTLTTDERDGLYHANQLLGDLEILLGDQKNITVERVLGQLTIEVRSR